MRHEFRRLIIGLLVSLSAAETLQGESMVAERIEGERVYSNTLRPLKNPPPLLADHPEFIQPIVESTRYEAPMLVDDPQANLSVRAWRFSYNVRGIIELPNRLNSRQTAVIVVHPWGIDDGQGWKTPEPAGVCDFCTPEKNHLAAEHTRSVIDPFLSRMRRHVALTMYSLPGGEDPIRQKVYRSVRTQPSEDERRLGRQLHATLQAFEYRGEALPSELQLSSTNPVRDYFRQFPGLDASSRFNREGFWRLPIPVTNDLTVHPEDIVIYDDDDGYGVLRGFLQAHGVKHVLLAGYAADMCYCKTTAGYDNLSRDFNVFLVGDASLATFPANSTPRYATNAAISFAALNQLVTQISWIKVLTSDDSQ